MESPRPVALGGSLPVPSVQELVRERINTVPSRYVRLDQDPPAIFAKTTIPSIPTIDMQKLSQGESTVSELERLHSACKDWGFFQLVNHGISYSIIEKIKSEIQNFFQLPVEEREKLAQRPGDLQGYGQAFVLSEEQKLDWGDMLYLDNFPAHRRNSSLLNKLSPSFREAFEAYGSEVQKLSTGLLVMMARALGMNTEEMRELFRDGYQGTRMSYYPPCPQPEQVVGLTPHSDASGITFLLQVNEVHGLEIKKDGIWVPVKPLPDAFIVNVGDTLEIVSNGVYHSVEHRATVNSVKERLSVSVFCNPNLKAEIGPAKSLINSENPPLFRSEIVEKFFRLFYSKELKGKSNVEAMKIERAN